jgi:hypothetical protein
VRSWETTRVRHGTASGETLHRELGEQPCDPCFRAKQAYDKRRREVPEQTLRNRLSARAQHKAYTELAYMFPQLYRQLYEEHRDRVFEEAGLEL